MTSGRDAWRRRVELSADKPFLHASGRSWTYGELDAEAARYAGTLAGLGVGLGTRVLVGVSNRPENVVLIVALLRLGAVEVPLQGGLTFDELAYQIGHSEAEILIADDPVSATVLPRLAELPGITTVVSDRWPGAACGLGELGAGPALPWPSLPGHTDRSPALILYTSGSTGRPKGVVLPAGAFASAGAAFDARFGFGPDDTYFLPLTMAHALGIVTAPAMAVMAGGALSLVDRFSPSQFWDQVIASRATVAILFPAHINLLLETARTAPPAEQNPLRLVITHNWAETFADRFGVELALVWGMTETGAMCTGGHPGERVGDGFVGTPMDGVSVEIRDVYGTPVAPGVDGEIWLHHPHAMLGYLKDEQATARTLVDGWVRSGDLGSLDENGRLFYRGRIKNMIKRSGENISAEEVENAVAALPGVSECLVFGVPDPIRSEEVALVATVTDAVSAAELLDGAARTLVRWKLPRYVVTVDEPLPRLANGKLDRPAVQRAFCAADAFDRDHDADRA